MNIWSSLSGVLTVRLISADLPRTLRLAGDRGITIHNMQQESDGMVCIFDVDRKAYIQLRLIAERKGDAISIVKKKGLYWNLTAIGHRYVLIAGLLFLALLSVLLPTRILFIDVEGNSSISKKEILAAAEEIGLSFGSDRRSLRSEQVKNALLAQILQLQWAGVNTYGCRAVITVRERQPDLTPEAHYGVSSIVAARDGVIRQITVERGNGLCAVGQAVKAGQVLISGYTDYGLTIRATAAAGEIYADTERRLTAVAPAKWSQRGDAGREIKKYTIIFGKKRINFYQGSGISDTTCVKMYAEYYLTLPGGLRLPISVATETWREYTVSDAIAADEEAAVYLEKFVKDYLTDQMIAGQILSGVGFPSDREGVLVFQGTYACREMIGQVRSEEIIK